MKRCYKCKVEKPLDAFGKNKSRRDGLHNLCKPCGNAANSAWRQANQEHLKAYRQVNKERRKAIIQNWWKANGGSEKHRSYSLQSRFGISLVEWNAMFEAQGQRCKCCGTDKPGSKNGWHTDHDHNHCETCNRPGRTCGAREAIRGIVCHHCNTQAIVTADRGLSEAAMRYTKSMEATM